MAGSTPNLGLYLPGGGSTGTWTPDEVADIDPLNQNFQKIDQYVGTLGVQTSRNHQFFGPAGGISSIVGMKLGDEYQESDANKILWRYDGSNWVTYELGMVRIRPASVAGTGIVLNPDGSVKFGTTGGSLTVNGVFTSRFKRYKIVADWSAAQLHQLTWCNAGVPDAAANYYFQSMYGNGAVATATINGPIAYTLVHAVSSLNHACEILVLNPADAALLTRWNSQFMDINSGNAVGSMGGMFTTAKAFDGFRILAPSGNFSDGELVVYGMP